MSSRIPAVGLESAQATISFQLHHLVDISD